MCKKDNFKVMAYLIETKKKQKNFKIINKLNKQATKSINLTRKSTKSTHNFLPRIKRIKKPPIPLGQPIIFDIVVDAGQNRNNRTTLWLHCDQLIHALHSTVLVAQANRHGNIVRVHILQPLAGHFFYHPISSHDLHCRELSGFLAVAPLRLLSLFQTPHDVPGNHAPAHQVHPVLAPDLLPRAVQPPNPDVSLRQRVVVVGVVRRLVAVYDHSEDDPLPLVEAVDDVVGIEFYHLVRGRHPCKTRAYCNFEIRCRTPFLNLRFLWVFLTFPTAHDSWRVVRAGATRKIERTMRRNWKNNGSKLK